MFVLWPESERQSMLTVSDSELAIIIISSVVVSGSHSVQAAPCLTCLWCGKALLSWRTKC